jgi:hypothetical protein
VAHGEKGQPALLGFVDDVEDDPCAVADAIEKSIAIPRLAHSAGRDGPDAIQCVPIEDVPEAFERRERGIRRPRLDGPGCKRVAAE